MCGKTWVAGINIGQRAVGGGSKRDVMCTCCLGRQRMKEMHEKPKLSMMKVIAECEVKSSCALL